MSTLPIIVYGNGDLYAQYFNAIVRSFQGEGGARGIYSALMHLSGLLAGATVLFSYVMKRDIMDVVRWMGRVYFVIYILFLPRIGVEIIDRVNHNKPYPVANVPLGLAVMASVSSTLSDNLVQLTEMNFTALGDLRYEKHGMVFASKMVDASIQFKITDSRFDENIQGFIRQCVFYDILLHKYALNDLATQGDMWEFVKAKASPARAFVYTSSNGQSEIITCKSSVPKLSEDWKNAIEAAKIRYAGRLIPGSNNPSEDIKKYLNLSYGYLTGLSGQADHIMRQALMADAIERGVLRMDSSVNASAAMQSYAYTRSMEQIRMTNKTIGEMASYWLPLIKNCLELILYGSFIFVILLGMFPFGAVTLKSYGYTILWIKLWPPLYAIVNLTVSYYAQQQSLAATGGAFTLQAMPGLLQVNVDMADLAGKLSMLVPALSGGLLWGMHHAFSQMSQTIGGTVQSIAGSGAAEAVSGNYSFGNTNFGTHSAFNTSANHFDTSMRYSGGQMTSQSTDGARMTKMPDGSDVIDMQGTVSNLGVSADSQASHRSSYSSSADRAMTASHQSAMNYVQSNVAGIRDMVDIAHHMGKSDSSGTAWNLSASSGISDALGSVKGTIHHLSESLGISDDQAASLAAALYAEGKAGGSLGWGIGKENGGGPVAGIINKLIPASANVSLSASGGGSRTATHNTTESRRQFYSKAKDIMQNDHFTQHVDDVKRAGRDESLRSNNEEGMRAIDGMNASFDHSDSYRNDMQASYQEAQSWRQQASQSDDFSVTTHAVDNNTLAQYVASKPDLSGKNRIGINNAHHYLGDPVLRNKYTQMWLDEQAAAKPAQWHGLAHSESTLKNIHQNAVKPIQAHENLAMEKASAWATVNHKQESNDLVSGKIVNHGIQSTVESDMSERKSKIEAGHKKVDGDKSSRDRDFDEVNKMNKKALNRGKHGLGLAKDLWEVSRLPEKEI